MVTEEFQTTCEQCGSALDPEDEFCGACGARISSDTRDSSQEAAGQEYPTTPGLSPQSWTSIPRWAMGVGALVVLALGAGVVVAVASGRERIEPLPDVYSKMPAGWALSADSGGSATITDDSDWKYLVPEQYKDLKGAEASEKGAETALHTTDKDGTVCRPQPSEVRRVPTPSTIITSGYNNPIVASGSLADGKSTVAGREVAWDLVYGSIAEPWKLPNSSAAANYPNYNESVFLEVCIKDMGLGVSYGVDSNLFEDSSENSNNPPTAKSNAFVPEARKQVHEDMTQRYEANIGALKQFLEDVSTNGDDGSTDISEIPTSISGYDEPYKDPFRGEGANPSSNKSSSGNKQPSGSSTVTGPTTKQGSSRSDQKSGGGTTPSSSSSTSGKSTNPGKNAGSGANSAQTEVEGVIRSHYAAIGAGDFEKAYSYFGPTYRSQNDQESWVEGEKAFQIRSSTINSLKVGNVSGNKATADVDVSFQDNTGNPRFRITWKLVKEGGQWKLDEQPSAEKMAA